MSSKSGKWRVESGKWKDESESGERKDTLNFNL